MNDNQKDNVIMFCAIMIVVSLLLVTVRLINKNYQKEKMLEIGKVLCTQLMNASITYYREHGYYLVNDRVSFNHDYPFDARTNLYFSTFSTYPTPTGKEVLLFFGSNEMKNYELRVVFDKFAEATNLKNAKIQVLRVEY
mgnify:CR=1 FL=1